MALSFLYRCGCGKRYKVYVPKDRLFRTVTGRSVNWARIDKSEEADGGVDEVERQARHTQTDFIDVRGGEKLHCPDCNCEVNLLSHFRTVMMSLSHPSRR
ncbi:hypothetical protein ACFL6X_07210 [Candidatus Latescibacterota bacterium]